MKWVLLVSLGPVQDFILTARKCQDLWYGSWLLSDLSKATANAMRQEASAVMVFPSADPGNADDGPREVANKILVQIEGDAAGIRTAAERARTAMTTRLRARREEVFRTIGTDDPKDLNRDHHFKLDRARAQVDELIEFFWVAVPIEGDDYAGARNEAERLLAARKNTHDWTQPSWADTVPKSSLDGLRESVVHEDVYKNVSPEDRLRWYATDRGERLSGIDLLKRRGFEGRFGRKTPQGESPDWRRARGRSPFASTQHLATLPWMVRVDDAANAAPVLGAKWSEFLRALDAISRSIAKGAAVAPLYENDRTWFFREVDGSLLQEHGLADALEELGLKSRAADAEKARRAFVSAAREVIKGLPPEPQPYYAIVLADGDRMGAAIDHESTVDAHRAISERLAEFAEGVGKVVRDHGGSLIYSGGDDVLALLPLHRLLECIEKLHGDFGAAMKGFGEEGASPTLSAGVVIAHQKTPLFETLALVREAEKAAKKVDGKDALALWVDKRGGERLEVTGRFDEVVGDLRWLRDHLRKGRIPGKAAHELESLGGLIVDPEAAAEAPASAPMLAVQRDEIRRVIARRWSDGGREKMPKEIGGWLDARAEAYRAAKLNPARELGQRLRAAEALARGQNEAYGADGEVPR